MSRILSGGGGCVSQKTMGRGGVCIPASNGQGGSAQGGSAWGCTTPRPRGRHPPGRHSPDQEADTPPMTIEAGGTHPTGMYSCNYLILQTSKMFSPFFWFQCALLRLRDIFSLNKLQAILYIDHFMLQLPFSSMFNYLHQ